MADYYGEEAIDRLPSPMPAQVYYGEQPYTFNPNWMAEAPPQPEQPVAVVPQPIPALAPQAVPIAAAPMTNVPRGTPVLGTPGTITTQLQGETSPTTRYISPGPETRAQPLPAWYTNYEKERAAFLDEQRQKEELYRMLQDVKVQSLPEAAKAIQAARQLQGQLGFASAIKAGVPMPQALAQYASAFSPQQTSALASVARATKPVAEIPQPMTQDVGGQQMFWTGRSWQFPPSSISGVNPIQEEREAGVPLSSKIQIVKTKLDDIKDQISGINLMPGTKEERAAKKAELEAQKKGLMDQLSGFEGMPSKSSVKRWRMVNGQPQAVQ